MITEDGPRKRCKRYNVPWQAHELTFSCYRRRAFLLKDRTRGWLADAVRMGLDRHAMDLWAYVFMPEHAHLLVWPTRKEYSISNFLETVKKSVAGRAIHYLKCDEPDGLKYVATGNSSRPYRFWQPGGGYDRNMVSRSVLLRCVEYIHNNPVRRGLVESPLDWIWSSARQWESGEDGPLKINRGSFPLA
jgi:putative transposase